MTGAGLYKHWCSFGKGGPLWEHLSDTAKDRWVALADEWKSLHASLDAKCRQLDAIDDVLHPPV